MSQEWKERWKQAPAKVAQAVAASVRPKAPQPDPWRSDDERKREINERGRGKRWLDRRPGWLKRA